MSVWVTPYDENLQLPLEEWLPDLNGPPRNGLHVRLDFERNGFYATLYRDFAEVWESDLHSIVGYEQLLTPDAKRRDTFEVRVSRDHLAVGMPGYDYYWIDESIPELSWGRGVVQFGHHSYNPTKDCDGCGPNTWHWDNIRLAPAHPFTIINADQRYVDPATPATVQFATPAPADAHLRFAGIGVGIEVSFDGGASWQAAQEQLQDAQYFEEEHFRSYWMPVPAGTQQIQFRGQPWWGGPWRARDISIWAP